MTAVAPYIEAFLREHLGQQRGASPHTCDSPTPEPLGRRLRATTP